MLRFKVLVVSRCNNGRRVEIVVITFMVACMACMRGFYNDSLEACISKAISGAKCGYDAEIAVCCTV